MPLTNTTDAAWTELATHVVATMPDSSEARKRLIRSTATLIPNDHPMTQRVREIEGHLNQIDFLQTDLPFSPPAETAASPTSDNTHSA